MSERPTIAFASLALPKSGSIYVLAPEGAGVTPALESYDPGEALPKAFEVADFTGKFGSAVEVLAPRGTELDAIIAIGAGKTDALDDYAWLKLGGVIAGQARRKTDLSVAAVLGDTVVSPSAVANLAAGILLRSYAFDKYKTKRDESPQRAPAKYTLMCADPVAAKKAFLATQAMADGVWLARDLVNEPANTLGPVELAEKTKDLSKLGVKVEILTEKHMQKLGMGALLGVAQGSVRPPRMVVMKWLGGKAADKPVAFVGKGVVFDTGGNSMKPAGSMEDMRGDMGGAAAVIGVMHTLAARKAKANVIGIIGCVENMVDGNAQRPGDIVTSMSGQTIEVLNTDAEGRLVLADALWYCNQEFQPKYMVNLATLTGAIMVALGQMHAGLFSNDDELAAQLTAAGLATQERLWRLPMGPDYDKLIDSKNADMKNIGGRYGGAVSAAQFLKRFVKDTPWAHLDIAGTAMGAPANEISQSWASGFGVRLLDELVRRNVEG